MLRSAQQLLKRDMRTGDDTVGTLSDLYMDERSWSVRHLVVDTGSILNRHHVLISPQAVRPPPDEGDWPGGDIPVVISAEQVRESPDVPSKLPISRQSEMSLFSYYGWTPYWGLQEGLYPLPAAINVPETQKRQTARTEEEDPYLISVGELTGYHVAAADGDLGHVEDVVVDIQTWLVRYLVIDTKNWLPGKTIVASTEWVTDLKPVDALVAVDLTRDTLKAIPPYRENEPITRSYEQTVHDRTGRKGYWEESSR